MRPSSGSGEQIGDDGGAARGGRRHRSSQDPVLAAHFFLAVAADRPEYAEAIEAVRADLTEAAKVTGPFTVEQAAPAADSAEGASPVAVTAAELGESPDKKK